MKPIRWLRRSLTLASLGAVGGAAAITARHVLATPQPLENRLFGDISIDRRPEGDIYYNAAGPQQAEPFVLLHDFYPGASNYEYRRLYPRLAADHRVYALDWLGFGLSERPALAYTGEFYARLLNGFLRDTVRRPATVVAHGLAANVAVRAASEDPALFARLVLIEPRPLAGTLPRPTIAQTAVRMLQRASLGLVPYAILSTRAALRQQLANHAAYRGEGAASDDVLDYAYANAHQFGGQHALLALLTGELDLPIENALALLESPLLIVGGAGPRGGQRSTAGLRDLALLSPTAATAFIPEAGDAVHEDQPAALMEQLDAWLRLPHARATSQISESRASARFPAGAIRAAQGAALAPAAHDASPASATSTPPATPASETRESAQLQPPASSSAAHSAERPTEELGEPYGLVSAHPHLDALEGLEEHAPASTEPTGNLEEIARPSQPAGEDDAPPRVVGKPAGEIEPIERTTEPADGGDASQAIPTNQDLVSDSVEPPNVTSPGLQPSEKAPLPPAPPNATPPSAASSSATSSAPSSTRRSVRTQRGAERSSGGSGARGAQPGPRGASGKSGGRASDSSTGKSGSAGTSGRKSSSHHHKKP